MKIPRLILISITFILNFCQLQAQPGEYSVGFTVKGKVLESHTNDPLEFVNVVLYSQKDSSLVSGTITNANGTFEIEVKRPGKYYLTADFLGYEKEFIQDVFLKPGNELFITNDIKISQSRIGIDAVEVVADKPFVTYQLDRKVIDVSRNPSAQGGTAVDALQNVPSIRIDMEGNVNLRGSSDFTVLIDGRQSPLSGTDALNQIPADAIESIEIITNPSVKFDPDGTTGIINIISKKGRLQGHSMVLNTGIGTTPSFFPQRIPSYSAGLTHSYRKERITYNFGFNLRDNLSNMSRIEKKYNFAGSSHNPVVDTNLLKDTDGERNFSVYGAKGSIDYEIFDGNTLSVGLSLNDFTYSRSSHSKITGSVQGKPFDSTTSKSDFSTNHPSLTFSIGDKHIFKENKKHFLSVDLNYQLSNGESSEELLTGIPDIKWEIDVPDTAQRTQTSETSTSMRVELDYQKPIGDKFMFEAGYTLRADDKEQVYELQERYPDIANWKDIPDLNDKSKYTRHINAGWAILKGESMGYTYMGGMRVEHTNRNLTTELNDTNFKYNYLAFYPSFAISKEFGGGNSFQASYSKRINRPRDWQLNPFPRLSDGYFVYVANPNLEPEYAHSLEFNYQKSWNKVNFVSFETFYHNTKNKIERNKVIIDSITYYQRVNIKNGSYQRLGIESSINLKLANWLTIMPNASVYYYKVKGEINDSETNIEDITWDGRMTSTFTLPSKTKIQLMAFYRGPEIDIDEDEDDMYWFSASVRQEFLERKLSVVFSIDDIFATRKRTGTTYDESYILFSERYRESPQFKLSLSLKLNQNNDKKNGRNGNGMSTEGGGGMDMDF